MSLHRTHTLLALRSLVLRASSRAVGRIASVVLIPELSSSESRLVVATTYAPPGAVGMTNTRSVAVVPSASSSRRQHH